MRFLFIILLTALLVVPSFAQSSRVDDPNNRNAIEIAKTHLLDNVKEGLNVGYNVLSILQDEIHGTHIRFQPVLNGFPVIGQHVIVHLDSRSNLIESVTHEFRPQVGHSAPQRAKADPNESVKLAMRELRVRDFQVVGKPQQVYFVIENIAQPVFAWAVDVQYENKMGPQEDTIFMEAESGSYIYRHPKHHYSRSRKTYNGNNGSSLPGTLVRSETTGNSGDDALDKAHNYAGDTYDYFSAVHGRDSLNNNGMVLKSTVHHQNNYNNAYWNGSQMVYGDGDGYTFTALSKDLDVVGHELSHGVTEYTADLVYQNESGALNEATSDIFAAAIEQWKGASSADVWRIGEDVYTPNGSTSDALRYMNNPTADGSSKDYYPERYTGASDNGGVHWNSGIANLFFYLLVQGGTHPRGKTSVSVTGIGMTKAAKIWYRALSTSMGPNTSFSQARTYCISAADALYSTTESDQVKNAWAAVGIGSAASTGGGSTGGGSTGGGSTVLQNGQAVTGVAAGSGAWVYYTIEIPSGASDLTVQASGGTGDGDLYVRFGASPTESSYDCRPYKGGNNETCTFAAPEAGTCYVGIRGYSAFSGVSLVASYTGGSTGGGSGGGQPCGGTSSTTGIGTSKNNWKRYTIEVPDCGVTSLTIATSGGTGDGDLYVRYGSAPSTSSYDCRPYKNGNNESCTFSNPQPGTWHIGIRAYSTYSGVTMDITLED